MRRRIITTFTLIIFLSGCSSGLIETPALEDLAMVGVTGYDRPENSDKDVKITVAITQPSENAKEDVQIFSDENNMSYNAILDISRKVEGDISFAQLRVVIFSKEFINESNKEYKEALKRLYRSPNVGANVFLAAVDGSSEELIKGDYPSKENINFFLNNLLRPRYRNAFSPFSTIHQYMRDATNETGDASMPIIKKEGKTVAIKGVIVFNNNKIATELSVKESIILQSLKLNTRNISTLRLKINENKDKKEESIVLDFIEVDSDIESNGDLNNPKVNIKVKLNTTALGYSGTKTLTDAKEKALVEKAINRELEQQAKEVIEKLQEVNSDPINLGEQFRKQNRNWSRELWKDVYPRAEISVEYQTSIVSSGNLD